MTRGRLKIYLGAAPGVGKTVAMLEEAAQLAAEGRDVVVALVDTHGRNLTADRLEGLEVLPRRAVQHGELALEEMDLDAVLARAPEVALVDEYAHTNAPGSRHPKRWQDVDELLAAGIDVLTTLNIQHIDSLTDVVTTITGVQQRETVPDRVLRAAERIELVDLAPQALRDRLASGHVYPAERIDAALSHYFRLGNLTALRELALLWLADEVDKALARYRAEQGIDRIWEARERVVVGLTGGPEGETLLRRGARIAARSGGGELIAVHVVGQDGLRRADPAALTAQRALTEKLGGTFRQVLADDVPAALIDTARAVNATQLVIGQSRRSTLHRLLTGTGTGDGVVRSCGDIDVHLVNHDAAGAHHGLPRPGGALSRRRRLLGFAVSLTAGPALTAAMAWQRDPDTLTRDTLAYQLLVIVVALIGGMWPAVFTAVMCGLTLNLLFIPPFYTLTIADPNNLAALVLFVLSGLLVSLVVDRAARRARQARRAAAESELLVTVSGDAVRGESALQALVDRTREALSLTAVRITTLDTAPEDTAPPTSGAVLVGSGEPPPGTDPEHVPIGDRAVLQLWGEITSAAEQRLLQVIAHQLEAALEHQDLMDTARQIGPLAETDQVRSALLSALSHDLRRPLAAATVSIDTLRDNTLALDPAEHRTLLDTAAESLHALSELVTDLLDISRLQAGALGVHLRPTDLDDIILASLDELDLGPTDVHLDLDPDLPLTAADPMLLQRAVVNVLANALAAAPDPPPRIATSHFGHIIELRIIDHGPGVPSDQFTNLFTPFHRLGDTDNTTGLGLGLALSRGFLEGMNGALRPEHTPGGGLTMVLTVPTHAYAPTPAPHHEATP